MLNELIFYMLMIISMIHLVHIGLYIVGANIYDIRQYLAAARPKRSRAKPPLVSVVIPAYNEETGILRTLKSVLSSSYQHIEIIVVDDGSKDKTRAVTRKFISDFASLKETRRHNRRVGRQRKLVRGFSRIQKAHANDRIVLVSQKNAGKGAAVNNGIKNYARGSLIMTLDADSEIHPHAIENAVRYFRNRQVVGVAANVQVIDNHTALGILQKLEHLIGYRSKKFYTVANCEMIVGGVASTYRASTLKQVGYYDTDTMTEDIGLSMKIVAQKGNRKYRIVYGADVLARTEPVLTYKALFKQRYRWKMGMMQNLYRHRGLAGSRQDNLNLAMTAYRIPMAFIGEVILMIEPIILLYLIYLSFRYVSFGAFIGAYMLLTAYLWWTLLPDEHLSAKEKLRYGLISPFMYFLFYVMNAIQVVAVVRCLYNHGQITGKQKVEGRWISPERAKPVLATA